MSTSTANTRGKPVAATGVRFADSTVYVALSDGAEIAVPLVRFEWLAKAAPEQRAKWSIEPRGYAVWWNDLDDGFEVCHLLNAPGATQRAQETISAPKSLRPFGVGAGEFWTPDGFDDPLPETIIQEFEGAMK